MKKLGICLLALAMVLGFVSCNKDAETGETGWYSKTIWVEFNTPAYYWSEQEAKAASYSEKSKDWYCATVYLYNNPQFEAIEKIEIYNLDEETNEYGEIPIETKKGFILPTDGPTMIQYEGHGIVEGKAIVGGLGYTLNKKDAVSKLIYYFDDGTEFTLYSDEKYEASVC